MYFELINLISSLGFKPKISFGTPFSDVSRIEVLRDLITTTLKLPNVYNYLAIVQSSGWGKSKQAIELISRESKYFDSLYFSFLHKKSTGYPSRSNIADFFVSNFCVYNQNIAQLFLCKFFYLVLSKLEKFPKLAELKSSVENDNSVILEAYFASLDKFWGDIVASFATFDHKHPLNLNTYDQWLTLISTLLPTTKTVLFVFDESRCLTTSTHSFIPFRVLRSFLYSLGKSGKLFSIFMDTSSEVCNFLPVYVDNQSAKSNSPMINPAFTYTLCNKFDVDALENILLANFKVDNSFDTYFNDKYIKELFTFGRPLWRCMAGSNKLEEHILFAKKKLLNCSEKNWSIIASDDILSQCIAVLAACVGVNISATSILPSKLVQSHLATLVSVGANRSYLQIKYSEEPIVTEAALRLFYNNPLLCLKQLHISLLNHFADVGKYGELVGRIMIIWAFINARNKIEPINNCQFVSKPVLLKSFLRELTPTFRKEVEKFEINNPGVSWLSGIWEKAYVFPCKFVQVCLCICIIFMLS